MKPTLHLLAALLLIAIGDVRAQEPDSTTSNEIIDPAQNRLFMMSTGRTMPAGRFSIADFEVFLLQLGYAPFEFVHVNFSYLMPLGGGDSPYWSLGAKVQVIKPEGIFQGLALGADFGFFEDLFKFSSTTTSANLISLNAAMSVGNETVAAHLNLAQFVNANRTSSSSIGFPTYAQIGIDVRIGKGMKIIVESLLPGTQNGLEGSLTLVGFRVMGKKFAGDFSWGFFKSSSATFSPSGYPFVSLNFFI